MPRSDDVTEKYCTDYPHKRKTIIFKFSESFEPIFLKASKILACMEPLVQEKKQDKANM